MTRCIATFVAVILVMFAVPAFAGSDTTKEFLATCEADAKGCSDVVLGVHLFSLMDKAKRDRSCLPKDYNSADVVKAIRVWLSEHPELADAPSMESIQKAYEAQYPDTQACRDTYARVDPFPSTTQAFLAYCANEPKEAKESCYDEIIGVGIRIQLDEPQAVCPVDADPKDASAFHVALVARDTAIRKWIADHTEFGPQPRRAGIEAAYRGLYAPPCPGS